MAGARLICFHHAGGASATFHRLRRALGPRVPVTAVNLPGRESRIREPRHRDVYSCATALSEDLGALLTEPHVLLGQSMGAIIAFTVAQHRLAAGLRGPDALIVSDYGTGLVTPAAVARGRSGLKRRSGTRAPLLIDSRYALLRFRGITGTYDEILKKYGLQANKLSPIAINQGTD